MTKQKKVRISRTKAKEIIMNSGGRFITTTHLTKNNELRTINGRYSGLTSLGNIRVIETVSKKDTQKKPNYKGVDLKTLKELKANKQVYSIR